MAIWTVGSDCQRLVTIDAFSTIIKPMAQNFGNEKNKADDGIAPVRSAGIFTPYVQVINVLGDPRQIVKLTFLVMMVGVLLPATIYSWNLRSPTPAELLVAICISLFSSVVYLWILDATSVLRFRSEWVSKSVYGAAIASVLGTSVAVYRDAFTDRKFPMEGAWDISVKEGDVNYQYRVIVMYSTQSSTYWGYSDYHKSTENGGSYWLSIADFDPKRNTLIAEAWTDVGKKRYEWINLESLRDGKLFLSVRNGAELRLARPNQVMARRYSATPLTIY